MIWVYGKGGFGIEVKSYFSGVYLVEEGEEIQKEDCDFFNVAIADSKVRSRISKEVNLRARSLIHRTVICGDDVSIGIGAILCPHVVLTQGCKIGEFFHGNLFSYVAHDCVVGDFVTFAPRVSCNGHVVIGDHTYVGTGAMIKQGVEIGSNVVVGMGAVVLNDVRSGSTVVGNPARCL